MNILIVTHSVNYSGANRSLYSLIRGLSANNHIEVLVNSTEGEFVERCKLIGIKTHYCRYGWMYAHMRNNVIKQIGRFMIDYSLYIAEYIPSKLIKQLDNTKFDVVYTNTSTIDIGVKIAIKLHIPHCWHIREFGKEDFGFISLISKRKLKRYYDYTDKFILISKALEDKYKCLVDKEKIEVVYNGFDLAEMRYIGEHNCANNSFNVLVTGVVSRGKGQEQAIAAVDMLRKKGYKVELYLAGVVDYSFLNRTLVSFADYDNWLHVLGQVEDIYSLRKNMNCELVCSLSEAFGRVTIEAMLHGLPVVGADSGCTKELIVDDKNGLIYQSGNSKHLSEQIERLINDEFLCNALSSNGYVFAEDFAIEKTVQKIGDILHSYE